MALTTRKGPRDVLIFVPLGLPVLTLCPSPPGAPLAPPAAASPMSVDPYPAGDPRHGALNFADVLRRRALAHPGRTAYRFVGDGRKTPEVWSFGELQRRAEELGSGLARRLGTKEKSPRVLLLLDSGPDFVAGFFACLSSGAIAVPVPAPHPTKARESEIERLRAVAADSKPSLILTTDNRRDTAKRLADVEIATCSELAAEGRAAMSSEGGPATIHEPTGNDPALLQYTSGSTSAAKGVLVGHRNLLYCSADIDAGWRHGPESLMVSWLPVFHDMGLVYGLLQPVYSGFPCVLMPTADFVRDPIRWLELMSEHGATHSAAPNFGYELCVRRFKPERGAKLDLSRWRMGLDSAETVRPETIDRFAETFAPYGFDRDTICPGYGLAEATVKVTAVERDAPTTDLLVDADQIELDQVVLAKDGTRARRIANCGAPVLDTKVKIVDPDTLKELPAMTVGEIWVQGPNISIEYWGRPEESQYTFHAKLATDATGADAGDWMRTGDAGFVDELNQLYFTARLSDRIVVRGRNFDPDAIETVIEAACPELRKGRVASFAMEDEGSEALGIAAEVNDAAAGNAADLIPRIREAVGTEFSVDPAAIVLVAGGGLPRTSSGKLRRRTCGSRLTDLRERALASHARGEDIVQGTAPEPKASKSSGPVAEVQQMVVDCLAKVAGIHVSTDDLDKPFADMGVDSLRAVDLITELTANLGVELPTQAAFDHPTVRALAQALADRRANVTRTALSAGARAVAGTEVAITGMACRFAGAPDTESFWNLIQSGESALGPPPEGRWADYDLTTLPAGARRGGFLEDIDRFDAAFFGISEREATRMDRQHRVMLEVVWNAIENAGLTQSDLAGSNTGVFIGLSTGDNHREILTDLDKIDVQAATGASPAVASNRISYLFDLRGPSFTLDAACASSHIALHEARQAILSGECDRAIVGGVHLMPTPHWSVAFAKAGMLSPTGRCLGFDGAADGYVRAEGAGAIVLERADLAEARRRRPLAMVLGSAIGQDGRTNGITAPSSAGQAATVRAAIADAGITPKDLSYVEAHGTGTPIGDPIEMAGLAQVFAGEATRVTTGSVKANVGHTEAAAGMAGLLKVILALENENLPPHLSDQGLAKGGRDLEVEIDLPTELRPWTRGERRRLAGVNSFGFGGANAHVVIGEVAAPVTAVPTVDVEEPHVLVVTARTESALSKLAVRTARYLAKSPARAADLAYTSRMGRTPFAQRLVVTGFDRAELIAHLESFAEARATGPLLGKTEKFSDATRRAVDAFLDGGPASELENDRRLQARRVDLPGYPFEGKTGRAKAPSTVATSATSDLRTLVLQAVATVAECEIADLDDAQSLYDDHGFDSLMTVELNRALTKLLPGLDDAENLFTEEATLEEILAIATEAELRGGIRDANSAPQPTAPAPAPMAAKEEGGVRRWSEYKDLIGFDPEKTYVGGAFKDETHIIHTLKGEGATLHGNLDVENRYSGSGQFHLTQMAAYAFLVQMVHGYLCYKHGVGKNALGMPKLVKLDMNWNTLVRVSKDVPGRVTETSLRIEDGQDGVKMHEIGIDFDLADGGVTGSLIGRIPIEPEIRPLEERTTETFATLADLYRKDPKDTYTGGTFANEKQRIRDIEVEPNLIRARIDVLNEYSGDRKFHLSQMGSYSCMVQLLLGYLCAKHGVTKDKLGMPVLHGYHVAWREMVPYADDIKFELEETSCVEERGRYKMEFVFRVGEDNGQGRIAGMVPKPD